MKDYPVVGGDKCRRVFVDERLQAFAHLYDPGCWRELLEENTGALRHDNETNEATPPVSEVPKAQSVKVGTRRPARWKTIAGRRAPTCNNRNPCWSVQADLHDAGPLKMFGEERGTSKKKFPKKIDGPAPVQVG